MAGLIWTQSVKSLAGGGGGTTGPGANEPAGYTQVNELDMTALPTLTTPNAVGLIPVSGYFNDVSLSTDGTAPTTSNIWDLLWPASDNLQGSSPGHKFQFGRPNNATFPAHSVGLYSRQRFKTSSNFTHNTNTGTKYWFTKNGQTMNNFVALVDPNGNPSTGICTPFFGTQGNIAASYYGNSPITKGAWFDWEILMEYGTAGTANGRCRQWINGTQVLDTGSITMISAGEPVPTFIYLDDVYGFGNGSTPGFDMHWYVNRWYISVK